MEWQGVKEKFENAAGPNIRFVKGEQHVVNGHPFFEIIFEITDLKRKRVISCRLDDGFVMDKVIADIAFGAKDWANNARKTKAA